MRGRFCLKYKRQPETNKLIDQSGYFFCVHLLIIQMMWVNTSTSFFFKDMPFSDKPLQNCLERNCERISREGELATNT